MGEDEKEESGTELEERIKSSLGEDGTVVKEVDLKDIHFSIIKQGEGFEVKRGDEVVGRNLTSVADASRFIHVFCYGAATV